MTVTLEKCPLCQSRHTRFWGKTSGKITLHEKWSRCEQCQLIFANPVKSTTEVEDFYKNSFYEQNQIDTELVVLKPLYRWLTSLIRKFHPHLESILEIGCGRGNFLSHFNAEYPNVEITGIEFDSRVTSKIALNCKNDFHNDYYERIEFNKKFDAIINWHVIEHVFDVNHFVQKIYFDLNPSGLVVIGTPAFGWLNYLKAQVQRLIGREVTVGTSSDHTYFFTKKILARIIREQGFEIIYHRVYIDNVNGEIDFSKKVIKASVMMLLRCMMKITGIPLFGKQILIARKPN